MTFPATGRLQDNPYALLAPQNHLLREEQARIYAAMLQAEERPIQTHWIIPEPTQITNLLVLRREEPYVTLFVGQLPAHLTAEQIQWVFQNIFGVPSRVTMPPNRPNIAFVQVPANHIDRILKFSQRYTLYGMDVWLNGYQLKNKTLSPMTIQIAKRPTW